VLAVGHAGHEATERGTTHALAAESRLRPEDADAAPAADDLTGRAGGGAAPPKARQDARRRCEETIAALVHDVRNPLTAIAGTSQYVRRRLRRGEAVDRDWLLESLQAIMASAEEISGLLNAALGVTGQRDDGKEPGDG
jgi:signal transduction histidine kinase